MRTINEHSYFYMNLLMVSILTTLISCVNKRDFDEPNLVCSNEDLSTIGISELKKLFTGETVQIQDDWIIGGYVSSSDIAGNFFSELHFQDKLSGPTEGLQIELELRDSHLFFNEGQLIFIKLKGLYLGRSKGVYKIGGVFSSFGNKSVGRLPNSVIFEHIIRSCEPNTGLVPLNISIPELNENFINTLVEIDNVEFKEEEIGQPFALEAEETKRNLVDCDDNALILLNSGFSDFQSQPIPATRGTIKGVLSIENNEFQLIVRSLDDINFMEERCQEFVDEFTSNTILISELADPDNNSGARFIELYNSADLSLSLKGWSLERYTNANTTVSSRIDLSEYEIGGKGLLVISPDQITFEQVYGSKPDIAAGTNSPADSNGDDNLVLLDPFGTVIDIFGVVGEDGSGTDHEFEDGKAVRNLDVIFGNPIYTANEWQIFNDTGGAGTINLIQNAPMDFTPGIR